VKFPEAILEYQRTQVFTEFEQEFARADGSVAFRKTLLETIDDVKFT
jgi:hypothetical protein